MAFSKGQSGNPGGRPKAVKEVVRLALSESAESIRALAAIRDESTDPHAVVAACKAILDRGCGKPLQSVAKTVTHVRKNPRELTLEELEKRLAELSVGEAH